MGPIMADTAHRNNTITGDECSYHTWLAGYLEQLEGKEAWEEFRERHFDTPEYYELVMALMGQGVSSLAAAAFDAPAITLVVGAPVFSPPEQPEIDAVRTVSVEGVLSLGKPEA